MSQTRMRLLDNPVVLYDPRNSARNMLSPSDFAEFIGPS
jgi:hypothetical protein